MHEDPDRRCVIVANRDRLDYILNRLRAGRLRNYDWKDHIITAQSIQIGGYTRGRSPAFHYPEVCVDDLEDVFKVLFGADLQFATMTATWLPLGPVEPIKADVYAEVIPEVDNRAYYNGELRS
jgi:hypothetical protein